MPAHAIQYAIEHQSAPIHPIKGYCMQNPSAEHVVAVLYIGSKHALDYQSRAFRLFPHFPSNDYISHGTGKTAYKN